MLSGVEHEKSFITSGPGHSRVQLMRKIGRVCADLNNENIFP